MSCHEVASEFFAMNAPDPPHWTLNSCFGVIRTVCVHLGPLSCLTKLGAKCTELVQKFVPRSCVESFHNKQPDPLHCTLNSCFGAFRTILVRLGPFGCLTKLGAKCFELVQKFVARRQFFATNAPDPPHWTLISCFGAFHTVWVHLGPFSCLTKLGAKRAELVQKFVPQNRGRICSNECSQSNPS